MSRKKKNKKKKVVNLPKGITDAEHMCGFRLNMKKLNQLWEWEPSDNINFSNKEMKTN